MIKELLQKFDEVYGPGETPAVYFAPGRVNLIGEHTDYNGGHVFPCALTMGTYGAVRKRSDRTLRFYSMNFERSGVTVTGLDDLTPKKNGAWTEYPKGVIWAFVQKGCGISCGLDLMICGNIPNGSGLSSSASLEVLTGVILKDQFGLDGISMVDTALLGQQAENEYCGMNCGIMDQFASAMGKKGCAIFLDTNTLEYSYAPVDLKDETILITNSNVKHSLVGSAYNDRRTECSKALADLQTVLDIGALGELDEEQFEAHKQIIRDSVCRTRAKHAVYENQRTLQAVEALKANDLVRFGELLNASHISLRDDYEVSCREVDILVELAWNVPGCLGSRITGGGFGGCTVSIVKKDAADRFIKEVGKAYYEKTSIRADFYTAECGGGAGRIQAYGE